MKLSFDYLEIERRSMEWLDTCKDCEDLQVSDIEYISQTLQANPKLKAFIPMIIETAILHGENVYD